MIPGQIEQVVSSADCRSADGTEPTNIADHKRNRDGGAAGTLSTDGQSAELLAIEDRFLVALAGRGQLTIGEFIARANPYFRPGAAFLEWPFHASDEALIAALEARAAASDR